MHRGFLVGGKQSSSWSQYYKLFRMWILLKACWNLTIGCLPLFSLLYLNQSSINRPEKFSKSTYKMLFVTIQLRWGDQISYWCNMDRVFLFNFCANLYFQMVVEWLTLLKVTNFWSIYNFKIVSCLRLVVIFLTFLLLITEYEFGGVYTGYFSLKLNMIQDYLSFA